MHEARYLQNNGKTNSLERPSMFRFESTAVPFAIMIALAGIIIGATFVANPVLFARPELALDFAGHLSQMQPLSLTAFLVGVSVAICCGLVALYVLWLQRELGLAARQLRFRGTERTADEIAMRLGSDAARAFLADAGERYAALEDWGLSIAGKMLLAIAVALGVCAALFGLVAAAVVLVNTIVLSLMCSLLINDPWPDGNPWATRPTRR